MIAFYTSGGFCSQSNGVCSMVEMAYGENEKVVAKGDTSLTNPWMDGLTFQEWSDATDAMEQSAYINGWKAGRGEAQIVGSGWFCLVCFVGGLVVGLLYPR
jgi:hypothetical protein